MPPGSTVDPKAAREAEARADARKTNILYGTLGVLFVALAVFLVVYNSGILERNKTAVTMVLLKASISSSPKVTPAS